MNLGVPLKLRWGPQGPARVASGKSSPIEIPLQLVPGPSSSSGVEAGMSGFLSSVDMDFGVPIEFQQGSQASSLMETCKFAFLSSWKISVRLPVEFTWASVAFSRGATGLSHVPSCFESILGVIIKSVQGNHVYLGWTGTSWSFRMVARPLEFLSSFKLRPPLIEVRRERRYSFPDKAEK